MKITTVISILALPLTIIATPVLAQTGLDAELACTPQQARLAYHCTIHTTDRASGDAVNELVIYAKADMPSTPMAHNIPPVKATATDSPGVYEFPITLDMYGRWAFSMTISGARQDMLVEILDFAAPDGEVDDHDHGDHAHGDESADKHKSH